MNPRNRFFSATSFFSILAWFFAVVGPNGHRSMAEDAVGPAGADNSFANGKEIFLHKWREKDPKSHSGDGLGPLFNDISCAACHHLGGIGGGGGNDKNVEVLSVGLQRPRDAASFDKQNEKLKKVHPQLEGVDHVPLHLSHVKDDYHDWRLMRNGIRPPAKSDEAGAERVRKLLSKRRQSSGVVDIKVLDVPMRISYRNTPALFGAALIDAIPADAIREAAAVQSSHGVGISGRVPPAQRRVDVVPNKNELPPGPAENLQKILAPIVNMEPSAVGRFGWRGQTASLHDFVMGACANELGLQVPGHNQATDPLEKKTKNAGLDLTQEHCNQLVAFVASIPRPRQILPEAKTELAQVERGEKVFEKILCSNCHLKTLGNVSGLYSDLLLHAMGPELADPLPASAEDSFGPLSVFAKSEMPLNVPQAVSSYFGGASSSMSEATNELRQEWRTPPLWGVRDSAPYLHDGRAQTLEEAIKLHGGEAKRSADAFRKLGREDRECLLRFLNTLAAPVPE